MSDIYKIGVALMLTNNGLSTALSQISHQLLGVHASVAKINSGFGGWKTALIGAASVMGGTMLLGGLAKVAMHGEKFLDQQAKLQLLGLKNKEIAEATAKAWSNTRAAPGSSVAENLQGIGEMFSIVGFAESLKMSTKMAQVDQVLKAVTGKHDQSFVIARAGELMGKFVDPKTKQFNEEGFDSFLNLVTRSAIATHGKVTPDQWLAFAKQGNVAAGNMTEEGLMTVVSGIQAMGGYRTGTAGQALTRQMIGGVMAQRVAKELMRIGLLDGNALHIEKGGHVVIDDGGLKGGDVLQKDQLAFFHDFVLPAWEKHGVTTPDAQLKQIYQMFGTGPAQRLAFEMIRGYPQITAERERMKGASGTGDALGILNKNSPIAAKEAVSAAWDNMLTALGSETLRAAIPLMLEMTKMFNAIGSFAAAHPTAMKIIGEGIAAIGIALVAAGGVAIMAALGPAGWLVLGIGALGVAIANFESIWKKFVDGFSWVAKQLGLTGASEYGGAGATPGPNDLPGGAAFDRPRGWNGRRSAEPPAPAAPGQQTGSVYMDGAKVGAIVTRNQVASASGPLQGSAMFDPTMAQMPVDFSYARG